MHISKQTQYTFEKIIFLKSHFEALHIHLWIHDFFVEISQAFFYQKLVKSHADDVHGIPLFLALTGRPRFFFVTPSIM